MKALPLLLASLSILIGCSQPPPTKVTLAMPRDQVIAVLGQPLGADVRGAEEHLLYSDRVVQLGHGRVINVEPLANPLPAETTKTPRVWSRHPNGRWFTHDRTVTSRQSVGGGAGPRAATPRGSAASHKAREAWGWERGGTALDQPAKR